MTRIQQDSTKMQRSLLGVSTTLFASVIVVLVIIAAVGYGLYFMQTTSSSPTTSSSNYQFVTSLAFSHWTSIGDANLTGTMSQYSSSASLWWYVHDSPLNTTSGPYTGSSISTTWTKFFGNGPTYWTVYNYTLTFPTSTSAKVTANLWYILGHGNSTHTLYLPYELDYNYQSSQWFLTGDWWGLPHSPGIAYDSVVAPAVTITTASSTSSTSTTTAAYSY